MIMKLWLDDLRQAPKGWERTYNARTTIKILDTEEVTEISLDHDLGNPEVVGTGYDVACHLERMAFEGKKLPKICRIHSQNPVGAAQMLSCLRNIQERFNIFELIEYKPYSPVENY